MVLSSLLCGTGVATVVAGAVVGVHIPLLNVAVEALGVHIPLLNVPVEAAVLALVAGVVGEELSVVGTDPASVEAAVEPESASVDVGEAPSEVGVELLDEPRDVGEAESLSATVDEEDVGEAPSVELPDEPRDVGEAASVEPPPDEPTDVGEAASAVEVELLDEPESEDPSIGYADPRTAVIHWELASGYSQLMTPASMNRRH